MKVYDLLLELKRRRPALGVNDEDLADAKRSGALVPGDMLEAWIYGEYDENPYPLINSLRIDIEMALADKETRRIYG